MTEQNRPDGLNVVDALFRRVSILEDENRLLKEALSGLSSRMDGLTFNISEEVLNQIAARTLNIHAQVLNAALKPIEKPEIPVDEEVAEAATP